MNIFVSYDFKNLDHAGQVERWLKNAGHEPVLFRKKQIHPEPDDKVGLEKLKQLIKQCNKVIVLVGNDAHDRLWINKEVAIAASCRKPIITVRLPNTTGAAPKEIRSKEMILFSPNVILNML